MGVKVSRAFCCDEPEGAAARRLPLVQAAVGEVRDWHSPAEIREAFGRQPRFVRPDCASLRLTLVSVVLPGMFFMRWLLRLASAQGAFFGWSSFACSVWAAGALAGFAAAAFRNPGVVPRAPLPEQGRSPQGPHGRQDTRYLLVNGTPIKQKWCTTCRVYRPLRAKHCSYCDRCVFRHDHHCTWLGNCIGLGNYRSFLFLITATALFFGHSAIITCEVLRRDLHEARCGPGWEGSPCRAQVVFRRLFIQNALKSLYFAYAVAMFLAFFVLILYHAIIIGQNLTTNEHVRDYYLQRNPFDRTCLDNYRQVFCCPYGRPVDVGPTSQPLRPPSAAPGPTSPPRAPASPAPVRPEP